MKITQTSFDPYVKHDVPLPADSDRITVTTSQGAFRIIENDDGSLEVSADFGVRITPRSSNHLIIEYVNP